jgi:hypothetical protein
VVEAALTLADQEGLDALSMQNLARRLQCGVMTIYGYVDSKEDLSMPSRSEVSAICDCHARCLANLRRSWFPRGRLCA